MKTMQTRVLGLLAAVGLAAVPALAVPPALDYVSGDTPIIIGVQSLSGLTADAQQWIGTFAPPEAAMGLMMVNQILQTPGLNADGSAAVALSFPAGMDSEPTPTIVLPIQDFTVFVEAMQGDASDDVAAINFMDQTLFVKNLGGGFMAMGPEMGLVEDFDGAAGQGASHEARLGSRGATASDQADIFVVIDVESMRPMLEMGLAQASEQMEMAAMMGGEAAAQQIEVMLGAAESIMNDGQTAFVGIGATDDGIWVDFAGQFADGSETGTVFADSGDSTSLFGALPNMDYIWAMAFDSSSAGVRSLMSAAAKLNQGMGMGMQAGAMMELQQGQAMVIGATPGLFAGGLFANTVQFAASDNPSALMEAVKTATIDMDGTGQEGILFHTKFEENVSEVDGHTLHAWGLAMEGDPDHDNGVAAGMALQQMTLLFGGEAGPSGYIAQTDDGIYTSFAKNSKLMGRVLAGEGAAMDSNESIHMVAGHLPQERTAEMYLNIKGVLDMVLPVLSMMGMGADLGDLPEEMNPIGFALATGGGGMHARVFVPGDVLEFGAALAEQFGGGDEWEDVEDEPESKPRF